MIRLTLSRDKLARLHEGQLINAGWWLWECEQILFARLGDMKKVRNEAMVASADLIEKGSCLLILAPGDIVYIEPCDTPRSAPPGRAPA